MFRVLLYSVLVSMCASLLTGCGVSETVVTTGIIATNAKNQAEALSNVKFHANKDVAENKVRRAVALFQASTGSLPYSLGELVDEGYLETLPALPEGYEFTYDPFTGTVGSQPIPPRENIVVPKLPPATRSPEDGDVFFGQEPGSLEQGSMQYGEQGPVESTRSSRRPVSGSGRSSGGIGGVGPMGEVMTGIGVQSELNRMSGSGSSSAGSYGRRTLNRSTQQHQRQQERALRDLGF